MTNTIPLPKFKVGQRVVFINDYGVNWGTKTITDHRHEEIRGHVYQYQDTDTPWFFTSERNFYSLRQPMPTKE